jgi:hypothetical protein
MEKVLVFSIALGNYKEKFLPCIDSQKHYCKKLGYSYLLIDSSPRAMTASESAWLKIGLMDKFLGQHWEYVIFIDADCEIREHAPGIVLNIKDNPRSVFFATGYSGRINSGVIIVRNHTDSISFFQKILRHCDDIMPAPDKALYENGHVIHFGKNTSCVGLLPHKEWNNNSEYDPESFIQHYSGGPLRDHYEKRFPFTEIKRKNSFWQLLGKRLFLRKKNQPCPVSASLQNLLPFYEQHYVKGNH